MLIAGEHAVVLGASISGLLAARALADHFRTVTVVERDVLSEEPAGRRGVPQGRHPHALLARGAQTLDELFPGILDELVADGAPVWDDGDLSRLHICLGGHLAVRSGRAAVDDVKAAAMYQPSRPLLECHVRRRVQGLDNVTILGGHDVADLVATADRKRINGVRIVDRDRGTDRHLAANLVVDAMGRGAHTPALLDGLGYGRPVEDHIVVHTTYVSQPLRIPPGTVNEMLVLIGPAAGRPTGMFLVHNEDDKWIFTVFGMAGHEPPQDVAGMADFARGYAPAHLLAAVRAGEPLGPVVRHRLPSSQWRRYDKMRSFPDGLVVCGDAMCSFNPIYGQGMTVASMQALALRDAVRRGTNDLPRRYFRTAAKAIGVAWSLAASSDLAFPDVQGRRTTSMRFANRLSDWVLRAAETDAVVNTQFFKVTGLIDPPARLLDPRFLSRVARVNRTHGRQARQPVTQPSRTPTAR